MRRILASVALAMPIEGLDGAHLATLGAALAPRGNVQLRPAPVDCKIMVPSNHIQNYRIKEH